MTGFKYSEFKTKWDMLLKMDQHWIKDDNLDQNKQEEWRGCRGYLWIDTPLKECAKRQNLERKDEGTGKERTYAQDENHILSLEKTFLELIEDFPEWAKGMIQDINKIGQKMKFKHELDQSQQELDAVTSINFENNQQRQEKVKNKRIPRRQTKKQQLCKYEPTAKWEKAPQKYFFDLFHYIYLWWEDLSNDLGDNDNWFIYPEFAGLFEQNSAKLCFHSNYVM